MTKFTREGNLPFKTVIAGAYVGHKINISLTREQVLLIQFSKLLNYFPDLLDEEWGGGLLPLTSERFAKARHLFETAVMAGRADYCWIHRKVKPGKWGPSNWELRQEPCPDLGLPFEPYFSCNGGMLGLNQASRLLGVDPKTLLSVKLHHLLDELVIRECFKTLLRPPPLWPKREGMFEGFLNLN